MKKMVALALAITMLMSLASVASASTGFRNLRLKFLARARRVIVMLCRRYLSNPILEQERFMCILMTM